MWCLSVVFETLSCLQKQCLIPVGCCQPYRCQVNSVNTKGSKCSLQSMSVGKHTRRCCSCNVIQQLLWKWIDLSWGLEQSLGFFWNLCIYLISSKLIRGHGIHVGHWQTAWSILVGVWVEDVWGNVLMFLVCEDIWVMTSGEGDVRGGTVQITHSSVLGSRFRYVSVCVLCSIKNRRIVK